METKVQKLFEIAAEFVAGHVAVLSVESVTELPCTVLSKLVDFLNAENLNLLDEVFLRNGVDTSSAWRSHLMKRWPHTHQHRTAIFREETTENPKQIYLQKHFNGCLKSLLNNDYLDPTTPMQKSLRDMLFFDMKPLKREALNQNLIRHAEYAEKLILRLHHCHFVVTHFQLLEVLKRSTKVLEVYLGIEMSESSVSSLMNLLRVLRTEGSLQELHLHLFQELKKRESRMMLLLNLIREAAAQLHIVTRAQELVKTNELCENSKSCDHRLCEFKYEDTCEELYDSNHLGENTANTDSIDDALYNEALVLHGRQKIKPDNLDERHIVFSAMDNRFMGKSFPTAEEHTEHGSTCSLSSSIEESGQGRKLQGIVLYNLNCYGQTAEELAGLLESWEGLQRLAIHYFESKDRPADALRLVTRENAGFLSLCPVILEKVRRHELTHLILSERSTRSFHLTDLVNFFSAVLTIINQEYRIEGPDNDIRPPLQQLRLPIVCDFESSSLFGGKKINSPVNAVLQLDVSLEPSCTHNRDVALTMTAPLVFSFIRFDQALRSLTLRDPTLYLFTMTDSELGLLSEAIAESGHLEELVMDFPVSGESGLNAVINMIERCQSFRKLKFYHLTGDCTGSTDHTAELVQEKLVQSIKTHRNLTELTLRGGRSRLHGKFMVGFMGKLFQYSGRTRLKHLDVSDNFISANDLLAMLSDLNSSADTGRVPVLEMLTVNSHSGGQGNLTLFSRLKHELETVAFHVNLRLEDFDDRADYVAQM